MMKSMLHSPETNTYESVIWHDSAVFEGIRFAIRRISLAQRIELTRQVRELTMRNEFLRAGAMPDQLEAALGELLARRLYLEWGLAAVQGLTIDGSAATPELLIEKGPEKLTEEIAGSILSGLTISEQETKNS
jgi:hypothetical protein